jgi:hypothetical protein
MAALKRRYVRVVPVTVLSRVKPTRSVPKYAATVSVTTLVQQACADGYSGWLTMSSGAHVGSGPVAALPSVPPLW